MAYLTGCELETNVRARGGDQRPAPHRRAAAEARGAHRGARLVWLDAAVRRRLSRPAGGAGAAAAARRGTHPFNTGCLPLDYRGNPGVNGLSYRGLARQEQEAPVQIEPEPEPGRPEAQGAQSPLPDTAAPACRLPGTGGGVLSTPDLSGRTALHAAVVRRRFPWIPLQDCLFTPELQCHPRGQWRISQGWHLETPGPARGGDGRGRGGNTCEDDPAPCMIASPID
jgi:hypothetical protein